MSTPALPPAAAVPVATQVPQFLAKGPADPNAIYAINGGGDDFFMQFSAFAAGQATAATRCRRRWATAATNLGKQVAILQAAGARYIMVWNVPDLGKTPFGVAYPDRAAQLTALAKLFNTHADRRR